MTSRNLMIQQVHWVSLLRLLEGHLMLRCHAAEPWNVRAVRPKCVDSQQIVEGILRSRPRQGARAVSLLGRVSRSSSCGPHLRRRGLLSELRSPFLDLETSNTI